MMDFIEGVLKGPLLRMITHCSSKARPSTGAPFQRITCGAIQEKTAWTC